MLTFYQKEIFYKLLFSIVLILLPIAYNENLFLYKFNDIKFFLYDFFVIFLIPYYLKYKNTYNLSILFFSIIIFILLMLLSLYQSVNLGSSVIYILRFVNTILFINLLYDLFKSKKITLKYIGNLFLITFFIFSIFFIYGTFYSNFFHMPSAFSSIGHFNYTGHILNIAIPFLILNFYIQKNKTIKLLSIFTALLLVNILILSSSRGSIFGLISSEFVIIIYLFIKNKKIIYYPIITFLLVLSFLIYQSLAPNMIVNLTSKLETFKNLNDIKISHTNKIQNLKVVNNTSSNRFNMYLNTIDMIIDNPYGIGIDNFEYIHPKYAKVGTSSASPLLSINKILTHPHNIILKYISEIGIIGGIIFIVILLIIMKKVLSNIIYNKNDIVDITIAIAFGTTLFHSMVSAVFLVPVSIFYTAILISIILYRNYNQNNNKQSFKINKYFSILIYGYFFINLLIFSLFYLSKYYSNQFTVQKNYNYLPKSILYNPYNENAILKMARYQIYINKNNILGLYYINRYLSIYPYSMIGLIEKAKIEFKLKQCDNLKFTVKKYSLIDHSNRAFNINLLIDRCNNFH